MALLDDIALIRQFVSGEATLASNQNLRVESTFNGAQLLAKRSGLIATAKLSTGQVSAVVAKQSSEYWGVLHQVLQEYGFTPTATAGQTGTMEYVRRSVPPGYHINYTEARLLWREWWTRNGRNWSRTMQLNVLIFIEKRQQWYPIREIICHEGVLYIKTLVAEIAIAITDSLVWLSSIPPESKEVESRSQPPQTPVQPEPAVSSGNPPQFDSTSWQTFATPEQEVPTPANAKLSEPSLSEQSTTNSRPALESVARIANGRLYVKTPLGVLVVEGNNLKYGLNRPIPQARNNPD